MEDDAPYAVYLYDIGGRYTYVGNFTREEAGSREALRALAMGYFENWEAGGGDRFLNYVAGTDHYDPQGDFSPAMGSTSPGRPQAPEMEATWRWSSAARSGDWPFITAMPTSGM